MNSKSLVDVVDDEDSLRRSLLVYISQSCIASNLAQLRYASHVPQLLRLETRVISRTNHCRVFYSFGCDQLRNRPLIWTSVGAFSQPLWGILISNVKERGTTEENLLV